jgi:hypothetical protein
MILAVVVLVTATIIGHLMLRFWLARRAARRHAPTTGEIWSQDGVPLYILAAQANGVKLRLGVTGDKIEWFDTWDVWYARTRQRVILNTGHRWKLEP